MIAAGTAVAGCGGVTGDRAARAVRLLGTAPLDICQGQGLALLLDALWDEGEIRLGEIGITAGGGEFKVKY